MKRSNTITKISNKKFQELIPATALEDLSDAESQTIQGGESANRANCTNNLKQIGLALHAFH